VRKNKEPRAGRRGVRKLSWSLRLAYVNLAPYRRMPMVVVVVVVVETNAENVIVVLP
jgi:hypothetical protein